MEPKDVSSTLTKVKIAKDINFRGLRTIPTLRGVISPTLARGILCPT